MRRLVIAWLAMAIVATYVCDVSAAEPVVTSDLLRLRSVSSIDVSPSGTIAAFAVRSIAETPRKAVGADARGDRPGPQPGKDDSRPRYQNRSHLFLLDLNKPDAAPRQLTFGERNDRVPEISPDGRRLAFLRNGADGDAEDAAQAWVMALDGGEAWQVTRFEHGAQSVRWSPDGKSLLVISPVDLDKLEGLPPWPLERPGRNWADEKHPSPAGSAPERTGEPSGATPAPGPAPGPDGRRDEMRAWLAGNGAAQDPTVITRLEFQDEQSLRGPMQFLHLFLVDPDSSAADAARQPRRLTAGFFDHRDAEFMPDGKRIVYAARKPEDQHPDRVHGTDLWQMNVDGTNDRPLLLMPGWSLEHPLPSKDGSVVAFVGQQIDEPAFRQRRLGLVAASASATSGGEGAPAASTAPTVAWLTGESAFDASISDYDWVAGTAGVIFSAPLRGSFPLMTINSGLLEPATLVGAGESEGAGIHAFGVGGGSIVYAVTTPSHPCVLMMRDGKGDRRLVDLNPWTEQKELSLPREFWITRQDGTKIQYWLMEPIPRAMGAKYPLALEIHGGPSAMWGPGEFTMWQEFQLLCGRGFGVVYANPRGSGGYGYGFQKANFQNWGEGPAGDVLAAVDDALVRNEWIDRNRLVVTGGSYGGYLTAWIVAQDNRFKAAVAQRGVYDLPTFFGEGNAWQLVEWAFGGQPFDPRVREVIQRNSPFNYVQRIRTPLLIMHSSNDLRTGVSQSEMLYRALKTLNRPVEYVRYPDSGHELSRSGDPIQRMDRLDRIIEFFDRYVGQSRPASASERP